MIKQYIKQSIQMLKENRLVSVISIAMEMAVPAMEMTLTRRFSFSI